MKLARRSWCGAGGVAAALGGCTRRAANGLEMWAMGAEAENLPALLAASRRRAEGMAHPAAAMVGGA